VILQRFASLRDAQQWLGSSERQSLIEGATPMLVGRDDVHIVRDDAGYFLSGKDAGARHQHLQGCQPAAPASRLRDIAESVQH
jgi:hypothetical protein